MSAVYLALDLCDDERCIIKRLAPSPDGLPPQAALHAFLREAETLAQLTGPFPKLVSLNQDAFGWYMVQEYIAGTTLAEVLGAERPNHVEGLVIAAELVRALRIIQHHGFVYGDLHPRNIIVKEDLSVVLVDLGLARQLGTDPPELRGVGTPGYAPPEQAVGLPIDGAADIYALSVVLSELLDADRLSPSMRELLSRAQAPLRSERLATLEEIGSAVVQARARNVAALPGPTRERHAPIAVGAVRRARLAASIVVMISLLSITMAVLIAFVAIVR